MRIAAFVVLAITGFIGFAVVFVAGVVSIEQADAKVGLSLLSGVLGSLVLGWARGGESAFGFTCLLAGSVWIYFWGYLALHDGLGFGREESFGGVGELSFEWRGLAIFGAFTLVGLAPIFLGVSLIFGVGPLAKPANGAEPDEARRTLRRRPSRAAVLAVVIAIILVLASLFLAGAKIHLEPRNDSCCTIQEPSPDP